MTQILFINRSEEDVISDTNKGTEAVVIATVDIIKEAVPDAVFTSFLNCSDLLAEKLGLMVIRTANSPYVPRFLYEIKSLWELACCMLWSLTAKISRNGFTFLLKGKRLRNYRNADVIIHLGMDYYSDDVGLATVYHHSLDIILGALLKKPVVIWAESMGPFRGRFSLWLARTALNRAALITVRDTLSRDFVIEAGINRTPLHVTADPAFLFEGASQERVKEIFAAENVNPETNVLIGVNPSHSFVISSEDSPGGMRENYISVMGFLGTLLANLLPKAVFDRILKLVKRSALYSPVDAKYVEYRDLFAGLVDWLVEEYDADVLLIPHDQAMGQLYGDTSVTKEIAGEVRHKERVKVISRNYNAAEIKGVIGRSQLFIGARFHADIAALSQGIPIVCFPYYHKFALISELGQDKYICRSYTLEETKAKVADAWVRREEITSELNSRLPGIRQLSALNGELVRQLIPLQEKQ
ncbi:polysaccharide pyruvyl transferase family protein [Chloroflexota bacterium]